MIEKKREQEHKVPQVHKAQQELMVPTEHKVLKVYKEFRVYKVPPGITNLNASNIYNVTVSSEIPQNIGTIFDADAQCDTGDVAITGGYLYSGSTNEFTLIFDDSPQIVNGIPTGWSVNV